ncbi:hypothetical protein KIN20_026039 [Parelaphostrongylus tenuis]|uniref:Uncharacterized protein n=1 Tax=Parelaphostrongylus tenuis TaxID=148309 RepID=A0AAD5MW85_PARTN|nr:hypothetical protein KIN20_026039 [Parelaphostrongylus tenuis]
MLYRNPGGLSDTKDPRSILQPEGEVMMNEGSLSKFGSHTIGDTTLVEKQRK